MLYIGVDLGTSAVKLLLMDGEGKIRKIVSREYPIYFPNPGWSEQDPQDWYTQTMEGIRELVAEADKDQIAGISFGGQMHGLVILDDQDQVIRPALLWNDGRTFEECDYLNNVIGKEKLSQYTANISFTGFTAPKILWVKNKEPENFARIAKIMLPKDYIAYKLTGVHCTDFSDASGMLLLDIILVFQITADGETVYFKRQCIFCTFCIQVRCNIEIVRRMAVCGISYLFSINVQIVS